MSTTRARARRPRSSLAYFPLTSALLWIGALAFSLGLIAAQIPRDYTWPTDSVVVGATHPGGAR